MSAMKTVKRVLRPLKRAWDDFRPTLDAALKHALFRWVLPRLGYEPFTIRNLGERGWPRVVAVSSRRDYSTGVERVEWKHAEREAQNDDGTDLLWEYAKTSTPVVLEGYGKSADLCSWDFETLKQHYGDEEVLIKIGDYVKEFGRPHKCSMPLGRFVDSLLGTAPFPAEHRVVEGASPYLSNERFPALAKHLPQLDFFEQQPGEPVVGHDITTFWMGSDDSGTPLHCHHFCDTVVLQLIGSRTFTLIPPHQALHVGYVPHTINIGTAALDPFADDREQFPGWDQIDCLEVLLEPGDLLLLPGFWFHAIQLKEPSLSASRFVASRMPASVGGGPVVPWTRGGDFHRGW